MRAIFSIALLAMLAGCGVTGRSGELRVRPVGQNVERTAPVDAQFESAKLHLARDNNALAIEILRRLKRERPADVRVLNALGVAYDRIGRFDVSRDFYESALGIDPAADYVAHNFGYSLSLQGRHGEAQALLARAAASSDAEVQSKATALVAFGGTSVASVGYRRVLGLPKGHISRTNARVQTLSWMPASDPEPQPIDVETSAALIAITDDRALAGPLVREGGPRAEWEMLVIAALSAGRSRAPASQSAAVTFSQHSEYIADPDILRFLTHHRFDARRQSL